MYKFLLFFVFVLVASASAGGAESGYKILGKILRQYLNSQPEDISLGEGVHLVSSKSENEGRAFSDDGSMLGAIENYLRTHQLKIRLPELMPGEEFGRSFKTAMDRVEGKSNEVGTGRGKGGGGGGGGIGIMGLMMGKMLAALGIGGVGLLAMKALMVSALALMLAVIIGLKKLVHSGDEGGHHVIHASAHGHHEYRRKRDAALDMAYSGWPEYKAR